MKEQSKRSSLSSIRDLGGSSRSFVFAFNQDDSDRNLGSSQRTFQQEWTCDACSYQNVDFSNRVCSVCGLDRGQEIDKCRIPEVRCMISTDVAPIRRSTVQTKKPEGSDLAGCGKEQDPSMKTTEKTPDCKPCNPSAQELPYDNRSKTTTPSPEDTERERSWSCNLCTFENTNPLHLVCQVCGYKRDHSSCQVSSSAEEHCEESSSSSSQDSVVTDQELFLQKQLGLSEDEDLKAIQTQYFQELVALQAKLFQELQDDRDKEEKKRQQSSAGRTPEASSRPNTQVSRCA